MEGVELLLEHEERVWRPGTAHSWEAVDQVAATYTNDITPLTLAAHKVAHGNILPDSAQFTGHLRVGSVGGINNEDDVSVAR